MGSYVVSLLVISTMPASYYFTLLILPVAIMSSVLIQQKRFFALALLAVLYFGHVSALGEARRHELVISGGATAVVSHRILSLLPCPAVAATPPHRRTSP